MRQTICGLAILSLCALPMAARAQTPVSFTGAIGLSLPIGDLGNNTDVGFNLDLRGESNIRREWGVRGDLSWDHFGIKGAGASDSFLGFAGNIVHHETAGRLYEFGGLGIYNQNISASGTSASFTSTDLGL